MKSLELLAARRQNAIAQVRKQQLETHHQALNYEALRHVDQRSDSEYEALR